jgi:hypothetical protein
MRRAMGKEEAEEGASRIASHGTEAEPGPQLIRSTLGHARLMRVDVIVNVCQASQIMTSDQ